MLRKSYSAAKLRNNPVTVFKGKTTDSTLIHGIGTLRSTFKLTARLTRIG